MQKSYFSFSGYLREKFGTKVHRLSLNAGFSCPNRDGTLGTDGCIFCNENGFSHFAGTQIPLKKQIEVAMDFFRKRFKADKFIAYFQNGSSTNADPERLRSAYDVIRDYPDIVGISISTRPDCIDEKRLDLIESYSRDYDVWIEYGLQSVHESSLKSAGRLHTFIDSLNAIKSTSKRNIKIGAHVILGFPGETREDMIETARGLARLPVSGVKLHVLHVLKDTELERRYRAGGIKLLERQEYVSVVCDFLERLSPKCVIFRLISDAEQGILVAPSWINDKQEVIGEIEAEFIRRNTHQGSRYE